MPSMACQTLIPLFLGTPCRFKAFFQRSGFYGHLEAFSGKVQESRQGCFHKKRMPNQGRFVIVCDQSKYLINRPGDPYIPDIDTHQVYEDVLSPGVAILQGDPRGPDHVLWVIAVDMEDGC